jgi:site-specific recombinase XerD
MEEFRAVRVNRRSTAGRRFPADPPRVEEIIAVMKAAGESAYGLRLRALIVVLWRAGLRISEALALAETDLEPQRGSLLVRRGKGGKRREVGMDDWGWEQLRGWVELRRTLPVGPLLCAISGQAAGRPWTDSAVRQSFRRVAARAGVRRRFAPHQLRHAHAVEMAREGVPLNVIQRQLGHANLGITSVYLQGIDTEEIVNTIYRRPAPTVPATAALSRQL